MKKLLKKLHKAITVAMCVALVCETVNLTGLTALADDSVSGNGVGVSGNSVSGNESVKSQTEIYEEELVAIAQNAYNRINSKVNGVNVAANNVSTMLADVTAISEQVEAAEFIDYDLYQIYVKMYVEGNSRYTDALNAVEAAQKAYNDAEYIWNAQKAVFDNKLVKNQKKDSNVTGADGAALMNNAKALVDAAKVVLENAKSEAEAIRELENDIKALFAKKPVVVEFYVLNRGLEQPVDFGVGPEKNYSSVVKGELYSGVADADGVSDCSYLNIYFGQGTEENLDTYIKTAPTLEELKAVVPDLAENEEVVWYVIKPVGPEGL